MLQVLLPILSTIAGQAAKSVFPDPADETKRREVEQAVQLAALSQAGAFDQARASIVLEEAKSEHWLVACWRPLLMLTFGALIVARWLGWAAPDLSPEEYTKLWDIVELGIGGYVIGRSVEKIAPALGGALRGRS